MLITSIKNEHIKELVKLKDKKYRDETKTFLVETKHLVLEAYKSGLIKELILEQNEIFPIDVPTTYVSKEVLKKLSSLESPSNVMAVVNKREETSNIGEKILILDKIQDPGNLGTILRTLDSAGIKPKRSLGYYLKVGFYKTGKFILNLLPNTKTIKSFKEKLRNSVGSSDYKASANVLKETMKIIVNEDLSHLLPKINVPTLLFWGTLDTATPISDGRKMEKLIPDCGLIEYPGATHFSYLENINNCNAVLNEFFKNDK